jgi:hypothetical protein
VRQPVVPKVKEIVDVPGLIPVATPVVVFIVATLVLLLAHVPEPVALVSDVLIASQTDKLPSIDEGNGFTVTGVVLVHPLDVSVNVIIAVPALLPETTPDPRTTLAFDTLPLTQVPAPDGLERAVVAPTQTLVVPVIAEGSVTVIVLNTAQPVLVIL